MLSLSRLNPLLRPLGLPYSLFMRQRRALYRKGFFLAYRPSCPCVAVGNIAWGGTGKTPFTAWLLDWTAKRSLKAVVLTRGYGGNPGSRPLLVQPSTSPRQCGDEPLMLALAFPEASVVAFPERCKAALFAENYLNPDIIILDDGMQHLSIRRDADFVLLRPEDLDKEWGQVIPSGSWREGSSALESASAFAVKARPETFARLIPLAQKRLAAFGKPLFSFFLKPLGLRPLFPVPGGSPSAFLPEETYRGRPYILISGVGNPHQVEESARTFLGKEPLQHFAFGDHYAFEGVDVQALVNMSAVPLPFVCTAKDAVKLRAFSKEFAGSSVWVLESAVEFGPVWQPNPSGTAFPGFVAWWDEWWMRHGSVPSAAKDSFGSGER